MQTITFIQQNLGGLSPFDDKELADVYFLQEVENLERSEVKTLLDEDYKVIGFTTAAADIYDAVVAISQQTFQDITRVVIHADERELISAVIATHRATKKRCLLISGHAPGFSFGHKGEELLLSSRYQHEFVSSIVHQITDIGTEIILGGFDMNNAPEQYRCSFDLFEEEGFQWLRTSCSTQATTCDIDSESGEVCSPYRETDYFVLRSSCPHLGTEVVSCEKLVLKPGQVCHSPIKLTMTIEEAPKLNLSGKVSTFARSLSRRLTL